MGDTDITLSELSQFYGTEGYHRISPMFKTMVTDGVIYIMENGYAWFVTDMLVIIEHKLKGEEFLSVKLSISGKTADATIDDGNGKVLHTQHYGLTDAQVSPAMYWENGVLMLVGER